MNKKIHLEKTVSFWNQNIRVAQCDRSRITGQSIAPPAAFMSLAKSPKGRRRCCKKCKQIAERILKIW